MHSFSWKKKQERGTMRGTIQEEVSCSAAGSIDRSGESIWKRKKERRKKGKKKRIGK